MAQNGTHGHQVDAAAASDDGHTAPTLTSGAGPYGNGGSSSSAGTMETMDSTGAGMGKKNLIPDLNMEERDSAGGISKDKQHSEAEAEAEAVEVPAADADKGNSVAAGVDRKFSVNIGLEQERRKRMKGLFRALKDLMPHVPQKADKVTILGEAIKYIKFLEDKVAALGKEKLQEALAEQTAARGEASSSFSLTAMPQTAQGMVALFSSERGGVPVLPAAPAVPAPPIRFKTWTAPNVVLTMSHSNAYISVCVPRSANSLSTVMSVLDNHGIDVITMQISADSVHALVLIFAHVNGTDSANHSSEEVYQRAVSEIMYRLHSNNN